jgi:hypothetical protein
MLLYTTVLTSNTLQLLQLRLRLPAIYNRTAPVSNVETVLSSSKNSCFQISYIKHHLLILIKLVALPLKLHSFAHCLIENKGDKMASHWKVGFSGSSAVLTRATWHHCKGKGKAIPFKPRQAHRVPWGWDSKISRQSAEGGKVVSPTHRPPLNPRKYSWYLFLLEAESNPGA